MIYLDNNQSVQDLFIPRQAAAAVSGKSDWASREYVNALMDAETARTESTYAKKTELSAYTPTTGFTTINGQAITEGGNINIEGTAYSAGTNISINEQVISVTGIPTTFKTINGSGITGSGNLEIEGEVYSAGTNIDIDSANTISVTGLPSTQDVEEMVSSALTAYTPTTGMNEAIANATAATTGWVESQGYLTEHQSLSAYSTTEQVESLISASTAATTGWVESQGYLTEHQSLSAYSTTEEVQEMIDDSKAYKIELSTPYPYEFVEEDIDALNTFFAAVEENPSITDTAYLYIGDEIYTCVSCANDGQSADFTFVLTYENHISRIDLSFGNGEYSEGYFYRNNNNYLVPNDFPDNPEEGTIANYDDGMGNIGLYRYDGSDWIPFGDSDNTSLVPTTEFPDSPVEGQIVNYDDGEGNISLWRYDGSDWIPYNSGGSEEAVTQAEYDAMVSAGTIDPDTIYVITDAPTIDIDDLASKRLQELDAAPSSPTNGDIVNFADGAYKYVTGDSQTGWWVTDPSNTGTWFYNGLSFSNIPSGQTLFDFRRGTSNTWRRVKYEGNAIKVYDEGDNYTAVVTSVTIGNTARFVTSYNTYYYIDVIFNRGYFGFRRSSNTTNVTLSNVWNGISSGSHYESIYVPDLVPYAISDTTHIPYWNDRGQVIGYGTQYATKNMYFNATGTSSNNRLVVLYSGYGNGPDHLFGPTSGGTAGQMLVSAGESSAPVWTDWIKAVKITSDAYDALVQAGTTDPSTLYLIDDE